MTRPRTARQRASKERNRRNLEPFRPAPEEPPPPPPPETAAEKKVPDAVLWAIVKAAHGFHRQTMGGRTDGEHFWEAHVALERALERVPKATWDARKS